MRDTDLTVWSCKKLIKSISKGAEMPIILKQLIGTAAALLFMLTAVTPILGWSQTEIKQSMNTIYEKRIYAVKVGEMTETKRLFTTIANYS